MIDKEKIDWPTRIRAEARDDHFRDWFDTHGAGATMHDFDRHAWVQHEVHFKGTSVPLVAHTLLDKMRGLVAISMGLDFDSSPHPRGMTMARLLALKSMLLPQRKYLMFVLDLLSFRARCIP
jgi:hypothetical protein